MKIKLQVTGQHLCKVGNYRLIRDSKKYIKLDFSFSGKYWDDCIKTVVFKTFDGKIGSKIMTTNSVTVPTECAASKSFTVSVFGEIRDIDMRITTNPVEIILGASGYAEAEEFEKPMPSVYEQILDRIEALEQGGIGSGGGLTDEQAADLAANTKARHSHRHQNVLDGLTSEGVRSLKYGGYELAFETDIPKRTSQLQNNSGFITLDDLPESGGTVERSTETKTFLNDFSYEANMDASSVVGKAMLICALYDESNDLSNKEIAKIEYNFDSENWVDVKDIIQIYPTFPYTINVNRSFRYTDRMGQDCVCFGVLGFIESSGNQLFVDITSQSQYGFRVTYYTD